MSLKRHLDEFLCAAASSSSDVIAPAKRYKPSEMDEHFSHNGQHHQQQHDNFSNDGLKLLWSTINFLQQSTPVTPATTTVSLPPLSSIVAPSLESGFSLSRIMAPSSSRSSPPPPSSPSSSSLSSSSSSSLSAGGAGGSISSLMSAAAAVQSHNSSSPGSESPSHSPPSPSLPSFSHLVSPTVAASPAGVSTVVPAGARPSPAAAAVTCYYPAVAQKSYGNEKRFLCPPPIVSFDSFSRTGPLPTLTASVRCDDGEAGVEQQCPLDETGKVCFKSLHVTSTTRCKSFHLKVDVGQQRSLTTPPITILSKPSKKTLKNKTDASIICSGSLVSLYNRVNSQTVRTKFLGVEKSQLYAKNTTWTPFTIHVLKDSRVVADSPQVPLTDGHEIVLHDPETGFTSEVFIVRKVDKAAPSVDAAGSPITHLQKIALQAKAREGQVLTLTQNITAPSPLSFQLPTPSADSTGFDDLMCWTIVGIEKASLQM